MPRYNAGEKRSMTADSGVGFDQQGYLLKQGADGPGHVQKTNGPTDSVLGVNYFSTLNADDTEVLQGIEVCTIHDGYPQVLCADGHTYEPGDAVYVSDPANADGYEGVATADGDPAGDGTVDPTQVGTVAPMTADDSIDLSGADGPELVPVDIFTTMGDSA